MLYQVAARVNALNLCKRCRKRRRRGTRALLQRGNDKNKSVTSRHWPNMQWNATGMKRHSFIHEERRPSIARQ
ncbi:hypothetical protein JOB18_033356 [Solea senegalensis]|uniref:Uncharacterized protein n=1 Tax=Solea senegalensis TaxID=28829 RepID=A0AAV6T8X8_SOLSE|nr:hypothetical protein JOB18_033356 [Solea senegalensis]